MPSSPLSPYHVSKLRFITGIILFMQLVLHFFFTCSFWWPEFFSGILSLTDNTRNAYQICAFIVNGGMQVLILAIAWHFCKRCGIGAKQLGINLSPWRKDLIYAAPFIIGGLLITIAHHYHWGNIHEVIPKPSASFHGLTFVIATLFGCLIGPFAEEILFRGIAYQAFKGAADKARPALRGTIAALVMGLIFALLHLSGFSVKHLMAVFPPFICALISVAFFEWRNNLTIAFIVHAAANFMLYGLGVWH